MTILILMMVMVEVMVHNRTLGTRLIGVSMSTEPESTLESRAERVKPESERRLLLSGNLCCIIELTGPERPNPPPVEDGMGLDISPVLPEEAHLCCRFFVKSTSA